MITDVRFGHDDLIQIAAAMDDRITALERQHMGSLMAAAAERCKQIKAVCAEAIDAERSPAAVEG